MNQPLRLHAYSATTRLLQASEAAHKNTLAELQRARTALQAVRATHQTELKKKEKEVERIVERWGKLSDMQAKLSAASSGLKCANLKVVVGTEIIGKGPELTEVALEQAEDARQWLSQENARLRGLLLGAVNEAQSMLYLARRSEREDEVWSASFCDFVYSWTVTQPVPFTLSTLFPMASHDAANDKLASLLAALREAVTHPHATVVTPSPSARPVSVPDGELVRLQGVIESLKAEIGMSTFCPRFFYSSVEQSALKRRRWPKLRKRRPCLTNLRETPESCTTTLRTRA